MYQKRACRNLQPLSVDCCHIKNCIRKEPAAIYNAHPPRWPAAVIVSEKSLPQSTTVREVGDLAVRLYQKRACRNLQRSRSARRLSGYCIRKEPAAIYNRDVVDGLSLEIVSEKSLPQSTTYRLLFFITWILYQKRACRNLQLRRGAPCIVWHCIRKEPAAIYNVGTLLVHALFIVSEKSLPQSTTTLR